MTKIWIPSNSSWKALIPLKTSIEIPYGLATIKGQIISEREFSGDGITIKTLTGLGIGSKQLDKIVKAFKDLNGDTMFGLSEHIGDLKIWGFNYDERQYPYTTNWYENLVMNDPLFIASALSWLSGGRWGDDHYLLTYEEESMGVAIGSLDTDYYTAQLRFGSKRISANAPVGYRIMIDKNKSISFFELLAGTELSYNFFETDKDKRIKWIEDVGGYYPRADCYPLVEFSGSKLSTTSTEPKSHTSDYTLRNGLWFGQGMFNAGWGDATAAIKNETNDKYYLYRVNTTGIWPRESHSYSFVSGPGDVIFIDLDNFPFNGMRAQAEGFLGVKLGKMVHPIKGTPSGQISFTGWKYGKGISLDHNNKPERRMTESNLQVKNIHLGGVGDVSLQFLGEAEVEYNKSTPEKRAIWFALHPTQDLIDSSGLWGNNPYGGIFAEEIIATAKDLLGLKLSIYDENDLYTYQWHEVVDFGDIQLAEYQNFLQYLPVKQLSPDQSKAFITALGGEPLAKIVNDPSRYLVGTSKGSFAPKGVWKKKNKTIMWPCEEPKKEHRGTGYGKESKFKPMELHSTYSINLNLPIPLINLSLAVGDFKTGDISHELEFRSQNKEKNVLMQHLADEVVVLNNDGESEIDDIGLSTLISKIKTKFNSTEMKMKTSITVEWAKDFGVGSSLGLPAGVSTKSIKKIEFSLVIIMSLSTSTDEEPLEALGKAVKSEVSVVGLEVWGGLKLGFEGKASKKLFLELEGEVEGLILLLRSDLTTGGAKSGHQTDGILSPLLDALKKLKGKITSSMINEVVTKNISPEKLAKQLAKSSNWKDVWERGLG